MISTQKWLGYKKGMALIKMASVKKSCDNQKGLPRNGCDGKG